MIILFLLLLSLGFLLIFNFHNFANKPKHFVKLSHTHKLHKKQKSKPEWVKIQTLKLKESYPHLGCRQLAEMFNRKFEYANMSISKSWVNHLLIVHRTQAKLAYLKHKNKIPKLISKNNTWALDTTQLGCQNHVLGVIDHGTRFCLCLRLITNINVWTILGHLFLAIGKYGKPKFLRSDNHPAFHSFIWYWVLTLANIKTKHSAPHSPWQNGRIERFFGTLKFTLNMFVPDGANILIKRSLKAFLLYYNYHRPHQHLNYSTPAEAWQITKAETQKINKNKLSE